MKKKTITKRWLPQERNYMRIKKIYARCRYMVSKKLYQAARTVCRMKRVVTGTHWIDNRKFVDAHCPQCYFSPMVKVAGKFHCEMCGCTTN